MNSPYQFNETLKSARNILLQEIADLEKALDAPVLDGNPWLLISTRGNLDLVYGCWPQIETGKTTEGWLALLGTPHHLCGAFMISAKNVQRHIDNLRVHGYVARRMHVREFQVVRLDQLRRSVALCEKMLAEDADDVANKDLSGN